MAVFSYFNKWNPWWFGIEAFVIAIDFVEWAVLEKMFP